MLKRLWWAPLLVVVAACSSTRSAQKKEGADEPKADPTRASSQIAAGKDSERDRASADFQKAAKAIEADMKQGEPDWGEVEAKMKSLVRKHPEHGLAWYNLGVAYEREGKVDQAESAYNKAASANP